jgi:hypothetical protein
MMVELDPVMRQHDRNNNDEYDRAYHKMVFPAPAVSIHQQQANIQQHNGLTYPVEPKERMRGFSPFMEAFVFQKP